MKKITNKLSPGKAKELAELLRAEPNIVGYSPTDWCHFANVKVVQIDNQLAAVSLVHQLNKQWQELAVLYVVPEFRNRGLGKELFRSISEQAHKTKTHTVIITRTPIMVRMAERLGYKQTSFWALPLSIEWSLGLNELRLYRIKEVIRKLFRFGLLGNWKYYVLT